MSYFRIVGIDRPEDKIKSLPRIIAESINRNIEDIYRNANGGLLTDVTLLQKITEATRAATRALVGRSTDADGRVTQVRRNCGCVFLTKFIEPKCSPMTKTDVLLL